MQGDNIMNLMDKLTFVHGVTRPDEFYLIKKVEAGNNQNARYIFSKSEDITTEEVGSIVWNADLNKGTTLPRVLKCDIAYVQIDETNWEFDITDYATAVKSWEEVYFTP
jgi:hypothetical protein